jgi:hypothetical protein
MIIDTHLHLIDSSALAYPWLSGVPALDRDFLYETYAPRKTLRHRGVLCIWRSMSIRPRSKPRSAMFRPCHVPKT